MYYVLSTRDNEAFQLFTEMPESPRGTIYMICVNPSPFPELVAIADVCRPYTILCLAQYRLYDGAWGWLPIEPETKDQIGQYIETSLADHGIEFETIVGKWLYLDLFVDKTE